MQIKTVVLLFSSIVMLSNIGYSCASPAAYAADNTQIISDDLIFTQSGSQMLLTGCNDKTVQSVTIPAAVNDLPVKQAVGAVFRDCPNLTEILVEAEHPAFSSEDGVLYSQDGTVLLSYPCAKSGAFDVPDGVTQIAESAFENASGLTGITLPESLKNVGRTAFYHCDSLAYVEGAVPFTYGSVFSYCPKLQALSLAETGDANGTTTLTQFNLIDCPELTTLSIPSGREILADFTVIGCTKLQSVTIPAIDDTAQSGIITISDCDSLRSLRFPAKSHKPGYLYQISQCDSLENVVFETTAMKKLEIDNCPNLRKAIFYAEGCSESIFTENPKLSVYGLHTDIQLKNDCAASNVPFNPLDQNSGDLTLDTEINVLDAVMLARLINEDTSLEISDAGLLNAEINGDGLIRSDDLTALLKYLVQS
jgi:hypothetical protein